MKKLLLFAIVLLGLFACEKEEGLVIEPIHDTIYITVDTNFVDTNYINIYDTIRILDTIIDTKPKYNYYIITYGVDIKILINNEYVHVKNYDTLGLNIIDNYFVMYENSVLPMDTITIDDFINKNYIIYDI